MGMSGGNGLSRAASEINVTPLIDVLLVLLIIFMVIVPATPKGFNALVPQPSKSPQPETDPIVVSVLGSQSGPTTYLLNGNRVSRPELEAKLDRVYAVRSDKLMFVEGDSGLNYSAVADAINMGAAAGVTNIGLITPKVEQGD